MFTSAGGRGEAGEKVGTQGTTVIVRTVLAKCIWESAACTRNEEVPSAVGVPLMVPKFGSRVKPGGTFPPGGQSVQMDHVTGPVPPLD